VHSGAISARADLSPVSDCITNALAGCTVEGRKRQALV
jgi:hypothetical protein